MLLFEMKVIILSIFIFLPNSSVSLLCFTCSYFDNMPCPNASSSITEWANNDAQYVSSGASTDISCSVGYSDSGTVYIQNSVPKSVCNSSAFQNTMIMRINGIPVNGGQVSCCSKDGCNWNGTTADKGLSYADITGKWYILPQDFNWVPVIIVIIFIIVMLCMCCGLCCFFCHRKKKRAKEAEIPNMFGNPVNPYINLNVQKMLNPTNSPVPVKNIQVKPDVKSTKPQKDIERYSAIDRKIFNRQDNRFSGDSLPKRMDDAVTGRSKDRIGAISKDVFSNTDFRLANQAIVDPKSKRNEKQDWVNVWKSNTDPKPTLAKGSETNAFQFK